MHLTAGDGGQRVYLRFLGLDTLADIYLNGTLVAKHDDFFLPERVEITGFVQTQNILLIHFHNTYDYLENAALPSEWEGAVAKIKLIRKPVHDFPVKLWSDTSENEMGSSYQGANPYHTPIGVYGDVCLETIDRAELTGDWLRTGLDGDYSQGTIKLDLSGTGRLDDGKFEVSVLAPDASVAAWAELPALFLC